MSPEASQPSVALQDLADELERLAERGERADTDALAARFGLDREDVLRCQAALDALRALGVSRSGAEPAAPGPAAAATVELAGAATPPRPPSGRAATGGAFSTRYLVGDEIARGGMGVILAVHDRELRRDLALKVLDARRARPDQVVRFVEEAQVQGQLEHPNICPVHELGVDHQGRRYFTMKRVRGRSLGSIVDALGRGDAAARAEWPLTRLLEVFVRACDGVAFAHSRGVVHRDLKPDNLMVGEFGEVLVMDWGLAKIRGRPDRAAAGVTSDRTDAGTDLTHDGTILGTPQYMAPEQARGEHDAVDARSDVYALGGVLYTLLTLEPPIRGKTLREVLRRAADGRILPPSHVRPDVAPELEAVCLKALSRSPGGRYASVEALRDDVAAWLRGRAVSVVSYGVLDLLRLWGRRNRGVAAVLAGSIAVGLVAGTLFVRGLSRARREAEAAAARATSEAARATSEATRAQRAEEKALEEARRAREAVGELELALRRTREAEEVARTKAAEALAAEARREAEETRALLARGHTALQGGDVRGARAAFTAARERLAREGSSTAAADLGLWDTDREAGRPLLRMPSTRREQAVASLDAPVLAVAPDGRRAIVGDPVGGFRTLDLITGADLGRISVVGPYHTASAVAFAPDGWAALAEGLGTLVLLEPSGGGQQVVLEAGGDQAFVPAKDALAFSADGRLLAGASGRGTGERARVRLWDVARRTHVRDLVGDGRPFTCVAFAPDGLVLLSGDEGGRVVRWDVERGEPIARVGRHDGEVTGVAFVGTDLAVSAGVDGALRGWDVARAAPTFTTTVGAPVRHLVASPDRGSVLFAAADGRIQEVDAGSGRLLSDVAGHERPAAAVAFIGNDHAVSVDDRGEACLWSLRLPPGRRRTRASTQPLRAIAASADGRLIATGDTWGHVRLWDAPTRRLLLDLGQFQRPVAAAAFSPDGASLLAASVGEARLYDARTGRQVGTIELPARRAPRSITWSSDRLEALVRCDDAPPVRLDLARAAVLEDAQDVAEEPMHEPVLGDGEPEDVADLEGSDGRPWRVVLRGGELAIVARGASSEVLLWRSGLDARRVVALPGEGPRFLTAHDDGRFVVWDLGTLRRGDELIAAVEAAPAGTTARALALGEWLAFRGSYRAAAELLERAGGDPLALARCHWQVGDHAAARAALARVRDEPAWYVELCRRALER